MPVMCSVITETEIMHLAAFKTKLQTKDISLLGSGIIETILEKNSEWMDIPVLTRKHLAGHSLETRNVTAEIYWSLNIDSRDWGIKSISIDVTEVKIIFDLTVYGESVREIRGIEWSSESVETVPLYHSKTDKEWEMWSDKSDAEFQKVFPLNLEINFETKKIRVKF